MVQKIQPSHQPLIPVDVRYADLTFDHRLGGGGFGDVFKGKWQHIVVAIKKLKINYLNAFGLEELKQEAALMSNMRHPHIVTFYKVCTEPGNYCIVMEYCAKGSLYHWLRTNEAEGWANRKRIALEIARGLNYLHSCRIIHRDLKSLNVLLDENLIAKLSDFGLSKIKTETGTTSSGPGQVVGTMRWNPPELLRGDVEHHSTKTDMYSYGMVLLEIATQTIPFEHQHNEQIVGLWIIQGKKENIPDQTPPVLKTLIERCRDESGKRPTSEQAVKELEAEAAAIPLLVPHVAVPAAAIPIKISPPPYAVSSLASNVKQAPIKPTLPAIAFGKEKWAEYIGDVGEEPPLPPDIENILKSPCPFFAGKRVEETHILTLIPKTVNGKSLTLTSLEELVKWPKKGSVTNYCYDPIHGDRIKKQYGGTSPNSSYWILMTKDVIPGSRERNNDDSGSDSDDENVDNQKIREDLVANYSQKAKVKYQVPLLLEAVVSILIEYLKTGQKLYNDSPGTYTCCQERFANFSRNTYPLFVGGFDKYGLRIYTASAPYIPSGSFGAGCLQKFYSEEDTKQTTLEENSTASPFPSSLVVARPQSALTPPVASLLPFAPALIYVQPKALIRPAFPTIAFGKEKWAEYIGDVGEEPPLPPDIDKILQSPCPFFSGKRVEETHILTLIPQKVNGKPLTLNSLEQLVKNPKQRQATQYNYYPAGIKDQYGDTAPSSSYWILLTKDVIPNSRSKTYDAQIQLLKTYCQKAQVSYEVPHLLEAATSILMEYLHTGNRLYSVSPSFTYTRCLEMVSSWSCSTFPSAVGGFTENGLDFDDNPFFVHIKDFGLGGLRKL